jgi:hypothetical protein
MKDPLQLHREQIEISGGRTMNIYTFDLDGKPMPEMRPEDIQQTVDPNREEERKPSDG